MNSRIHAQSLQYNRMENDLGKYWTMFVVSMVCHCAFFAIVVWMPAHTPPERFTPRIINVDLIALPLPKTASTPAPKVNTQPAQPAPKPVPAKPPAETVVVKPPEPAPKAAPAPESHKEKISLKKQTFKEEPVVKPVIKRIEKQVEQSRPNSVAEAISKLKKKVEQAEAAQPAEPEQPQITEQADTGGGGGSGSEQLESLLQIYKLEIAFRVQKHWAYSEQLAIKKGPLKALLVFKVMPDGQIRDIFFTERSGDAYLDDSAYKAIIKSNPVPPHPKGITMPFITVGLRFTPEGVK